MLQLINGDTIFRAVTVDQNDQGKDYLFQAKKTMEIPWTRWKTVLSTQHSAAVQTDEKGAFAGAPSAMAGFKTLTTYERHSSYLTATLSRESIFN